MKKLKNPFVVEGYATERYFCDRVEETQRLLKALESRRNVTMISPRRMGKSGLIKHAFEVAQRSHPDVKCYYIDILHTVDLSGFINAVANAVFGSLDSSIEKLYNSVARVFRNCRPVISPDVITGLPNLSLNIEKGQEEHTLRQIFDYLQEKGRRVYMALDEFQQIREYPEKGVEALLRSYIQFLPDISFIFAGSRKHMMQEMFSMPQSPFYMSTQTMSLGPIDRDSYFDFAHAFFHEDGRELCRDAFYHVYDTVYGHTWYVQYWLSRLFDSEYKEIGVAETNDALAAILKEEEDTFYTYTQLLTANQLAVLSAVARMGVLSAPVTSEMIKEYGLGAQSTVRSCVAALTAKELLLQERDRYTVYNRFFRLWLARR